MRKVVILVIMLLLGTSGAQAQAESTPQPVRFFMTFVPNVQFSPMYVAEAKGYFEQAGLSVTMEHGDEPLGVDLIAAGERDFGLISGEQVLTARANGRPVVSVYEWFQDYPVGVLYPLDAGIEQVLDLTGRNVGIPGRFGASYTGLTALLAANGLTERDIDLEEIGYNAVEVFCLGGVEASVVYVNNEPIQIAGLAEAGECDQVSAVGVFRVSDAVDLVSNGLITSEALIVEQPELVAATVAAFDAGLRDAMANPAEAYLLSIGFVEGLEPSAELRAALEQVATDRSEFLALAESGPEERAEYRTSLAANLHAAFASVELVQFDVLLSSIDLWEAEQPGYADAASWEATQDVLIDIGYITDAIEPTDAFTNDFLPG